MGVVGPSSAVRSVACRTERADLQSAPMIDFDSRGRVALITIDRPEARNAVNGAVASGLEAAVERLEAGSGLWAGVMPPADRCSAQAPT